MTATAERLAELLARPLDQQRWLIVFLDGLGFAEHTLVGALGVVEGSTENAPYVPAWSPT